MFDQETATCQALALIFWRLDEASKKKIRFVSREWKNIVEKYFLRFVPILNDTSYPFIQKAGVHLDTIIIQDFTRDIDYDPLQLQTCPTTIIFRHCNSSATRQSISESNMEKPLWRCQNMRTLIFEENSLRFVNRLALDGLQFSNLTHLMISLRNRKCDVGDEYVLSQLSRVKMPSLSNVRLHSLLLSGDTENAMLYATLFEFVALHASTMTSLSLRHCFKPYSNLNETMEQSNLPWPDTKLEAVRLDMSNLALKNLTIFLDKYEGIGQFSLGLNLLASQCYLVKLEIQFSENLDNSRSLDLYTHVKNCVSRNLKSLRHLCLSRRDIESPILHLENVLRATYNCSASESLKLFTFSIPTFPTQFPYTIRSLELMGSLYPSLLAEIRGTLPRLEFLQFANLTEDYLINSNHYNDMMVNLKNLLSMHRLRLIKWNCPKFDLEFLSNIRGVSVRTAVNNSFVSIINIQRNM